MSLSNEISEEKLNRFKLITESVLEYLYSIPTKDISYVIDHSNQMIKLFFTLKVFDSGMMRIVLSDLQIYGEIFEIEPNKLSLTTNLSFKAKSNYFQSHTKIPLHTMNINNMENGNFELEMKQFNPNLKF